MLDRMVEMEFLGQRLNPQRTKDKVTAERTKSIGPNTDQTSQLVVQRGMKWDLGTSQCFSVTVPSAEPHISLPLFLKMLRQ